MQDSRVRRPQPSEGAKVLLFVGYTAGVYICSIVAALFEQKIYKVPYVRNSNPNLSDIFTDKITPLGVTSGLSCLLGYLAISNSQLTFDIPIKKLAKVAFCDTLTHICLISALILTNYTTLIVVNTTSLISVILVGSFCTGVNYRSRDNQEEGEGGTQRQGHNQSIGPEKLGMCAIVCLGIIVFSVFSGQNDSSTQATHRSVGTFLLIILLYGTAITLQGFRPDFMAQIKHQYRPSSLFLYFSVNGVIFFFVFLISILTLNIKYFFSFIFEHQRLLIDLSIFGVLQALGGLFAFKLVNTFRQHIYPLVSNTRKCMTICINVAWYGHHLHAMQWVGIFLVFAGIMVEFVSNYNLLDKITPNKNKRGANGQYNKVTLKEDDLKNNYQGQIGEYQRQFAEGVEGI